MFLSYWAYKIFIVTITSINVIIQAVDKRASKCHIDSFSRQIVDEEPPYWVMTVSLFFCCCSNHGEIISFWDPFHHHGAEGLACDVILCAISILSPISSSRQQLRGFLRSRLTASGKYQKGSLLPCCTRLDFSRPCNFYLASSFDQSPYILDN